MFLELTSEDFLYKQVYMEIKKLIEDAELKEGAKLPSLRSLANINKISINTVETAYGLLQEEGYIRSEKSSGYYVNSLENVLTSITDTNRYGGEGQLAYDFSYGGIDSKHFPISNWKLSYSLAADPSDSEIFFKIEQKGYRPLRTAISRYLKASRGIDVDDENIIISAGTEHLFNIVRSILDEDTVYGFENPGYCWGSKYFISDSLKSVAIEIDKSGALPNSLSSSKSCLLLTPAHQFPMGMIMPDERREELISWVEASPDRFIIEDDYDGEFNFSHISLPPLYKKNEEKIIYIGSFSRALSPALRISYMILPDSLIGVYEDRFKGYDCPCSTLQQKALTNFIGKGYFQRHLNRMRNLYNKKHKLMKEKLYEIENIQIHYANAGMSFVVEIKNYSKDMKDKFIDSGINLTSLNKFKKEKNMENYFILDFAKLSQKDMISGLALLDEIINE